MKTKQVKQDILNQWKSMSFPKLTRFLDVICPRNDPDSVLIYQRVMFINMRECECCGKLRKTFFCYKMTTFSLWELKFSGNIYFKYTKRLTSAKVEEVLSLQRNDRK